MTQLTPEDERALGNLILKVQNGEIAPFIGAGASLGSHAPSGDDLISLIKEKFNYVDFADCSYNLLEICREIEENEKRVELGKFIQSLFYGLKPHKAHSILIKYPWPAIYTTNYDDIIEKEFEEYYNNDRDTARLCKPIITGKGEGIYLNKKGEIKLFKLMGDAKRDEPDQCPVLTRKEYNNRANARRKMLETISNYIHEGAILYIGYSFKDGIAFEIIDELLQLYDGTIDASYALVPGLKHGSKIERQLARRRISPIPLNFEEFDKILDTRAAYPTKNNQLSNGILLKLKYKDIKIPHRENREFREHFKIVSQEDLSESEINDVNEKEKIENFLKGQLEGWKPFQKNWDFKRDIYGIISRKLQEELLRIRPEDNDIILLLGGGGLGKSIMLKRLAYESYIAGHPVIVLNDHQSFFDNKLINKFCKDVNYSEKENGRKHKVVIIIDNADANIDNIKKIRTYLKNNSSPAIIIAAARPNEWEYSKKQWGLGRIVSQENTFQIPQQMAKGEIKRLVEHIGKLLDREDFIADTEFWVEKAINDYEGDFFAIIYSLVDPARRKLDEILWDEYRKLPSEPTKRAYEYICIFYQYGLTLKLEMIVNPLLKEFGYTYKQFSKDIVENEAKSLMIKIEDDIIGDELYRAKNKLIAEKLVRKLFDKFNTERQNALAQRYLEILNEVKAMDKREVDLIRSLLVTYLGPNGIDKGRVSETHLTMFYDALLSNGVEDCTLIHHYGVLESNNNNFEKARKLLNKSLNILRDNMGWGRNTEQEKNILNSLGVLYSREALKYLSADQNKAFSLYGKAESYFSASNRKDVTSPYSYHSKAVTLFKMAEYYERIGNAEDEYRYYSESLKVIQEAKESVADDDLELLLNLESKIYIEKFNDFHLAKSNLLSFISNSPNSIYGYILLSKIIYRESQKNQKSSEAYREYLKDALIYTNVGLSRTRKDNDLLKIKYDILKELDPNDTEILYDLLLERYSMFDGDCTDLKLLFELGIVSFERKEYKEANSFFKELNRKSYGHPYRGGIKRVAKSKTREKKSFKGHITKLIQNEDGYVYSDEIGYDIPFSVPPQKRELYLGEDVEFNMAFNYRGPFAIELKPR